MAHKHNRRRTRPRNRHNNSLNLINTLTDPVASFNSSLSSNLATLPTFRAQRSFPPTFLSTTNSISAKHWQNRYTAWQNRETTQKREAAKVEAEQIKVFGGEPGDDIGLCYKMMEVFEGMEWIQ